MSCLTALDGVYQFYYLLEKKNQTSFPIQSWRIYNVSVFKLFRSQKRNCTDFLMLLNTIDRGYDARLCYVEIQNVLIRLYVVSEASFEQRY